MLSRLGSSLGRLDEERLRAPLGNGEPAVCLLPYCQSCCPAVVAKSSDVPLSTTPCGCQLPVCQRCSNQRLLVDASLGSAPSWLRSRLEGSGRVLTPAENRLIATLYYHLAQQLDGYDELQFLQNGSGWSSLSTSRATRLVHPVSKLLSCGVFQVLTAL